MSANPLPDTEPPASAAAHWFNRRRSGEMTLSEVRAFEVWLARDPVHAAAFKTVERAWEFVGELEDDPAVMDARDRDQDFLAARARRRVMGSVAASVAALAVGGWALASSGVLSALPWFAPPPVQEFRTVKGQTRAVTLADGSVVTLDTNTIIQAQLSNSERHVTLVRGQAFFEVAKERSRPFLVAAAGKTVRATGTAFDVRYEPGRFEVTLIEGRVRVQEAGVQRKDAPVADMRPGWRLAVGEDTRWRVEPVDLVKVTSWHNGVLSFYNDKLVDAAAEMNRYSDRKIVFSGEPPDAVVLGNFRAGDVDNFVRAIKLNKLVRVVSESEDKVELASR